MAPEQSSLPCQANLTFVSFICAVSALGGFLWGFDAIVISGTISAVKSQFALAAAMEGLFVSSGLIGAVMGSAASGWMGDRYGRVRCLTIAAVLLLVSAVGSAFAPNITVLVVSRWIGGLGVGLSAMICPLYISEISPAHLRGRLVSVFQFAIAIGIVAALFNNVACHRWAASACALVAPDSFSHWFLVDQTWRSMFAAELPFCVLFLALTFLLPESPRWLVKTCSGQQARRVLERIFSKGADSQYREIRETIESESSSGKGFLDLLDRRYAKPLIIGVLLATFSQFSGINVVFYYGASLFENAGFQVDEALTGTAVLGSVSMVFTVVAMWLMDKLGRRFLLLIGTLGAMACLICSGSVFGGGSMVSLIVCLCGFVAFFAFSIGPIKFVFASEVFPTNIRSHAMAVVILAMWLTDTLVAQFFPLLRDSVGPSATFFVFAAILTPQLVLVAKFMPETAGKSLEEIEKEFYHS